VLPRALDSLLNQDLDHARYEIVVVDNNCTDGTSQIIESFCSNYPNVRSVFEPTQGLSQARNTGILTARAPLIAFTDDDVRVSRDWVSTIVRLFAEHPEAAGLGGRVLPNWGGPWPAWLTREHWAPLALVDYGDSAFHVNTSKPLCLIGANSAYRRDAFNRIGMFALHVQAVGREVAIEDHEFLLRLWRSRGQGYYCPSLTVISDIAPERMQRRYHRRWHYRHGHFLAVMRDEDLERSRMGRFLGVPAHLYRQLLGDLVAWLSTLARGRSDRAFAYEINLWSHAGFLRTRWLEFFSPWRRARRREANSLAAPGC
jgi:glycosyltransferase involved in cell wall biosynthesis